MTIDVDVLIVGAGISGIGAGIELLRRGNDSFLVLEAEDEPGGTWRANTYPGVAVDIPSSSYCYSFETDFPWSRVYAPGAELKRYVGHCVEKYGVGAYIRFGARAVRSSFDASRDVWTTQLGDGTAITSRYLIAATGLFSQPKLPDIPGLQSFGGKSMHTAQWDHGYDLGSRRVAVIGTGASAVQVVPEIAPVVDELRVFQRTPVWVGPRMDAPVARRGLRRFALGRRWLRFLSDSLIEFLTSAVVYYRRFPYVVWLVQRLVRRWMLRTVHDPTLASCLVPEYGLGCKRPTTSNGYLQAFNRSNVHLVTHPIARICAEGIVTADGVVHAVDAIVLATGFLTTEQGNAPSFEVVGRHGVELGQFWEENRLQAYAGVSVPGFPNFFLTAGPYSGGFNWFAALEANVDHMMCCIDETRARGATSVEVRRDVHERYMAQMWRRAEGTVFKDGSCATARSYYLDRHGDASLPLPYTPWWRVLTARRHRERAYDFHTADVAIDADVRAGVA
jgi:cation diffusion facilitator CzcD-associated flavoprotein CzcO